MNEIKRVNSVHLKATKAQVWELLTASKWVKQYMYNCAVYSTYEKGSTIEWKGEYNGQKSHLKGEILEIEPLLLLKYTGIDPLVGDENNPADYFHVTYELQAQKDGVLLTVINAIFDGNEERMEHIVVGWEQLIFPKLIELCEAI